MDKKRIAQSLDKIATNVAKKGIFVVNKQDGLYVVQEHITNTVLDKDIPLRNIANYICNIRNKGKILNPGVQKKLTDLISLYFKYQNDIMFYKHTLKHTTDVTKYDATHARLHDTFARLSHTKDELQRYG